MITAIVTFKLPGGIDSKKAGELFKGSAPKYRGLKGLVRKYYLFDEAQQVAGGVYLWKSKADAEQLYTADWKAWAKDRYGAEPEVRYFQTPVIVDNDSDKTTFAEAAD